MPPDPLQSNRNLLGNPVFHCGMHLQSDHAGCSAWGETDHVCEVPVKSNEHPPEVDSSFSNCFVGRSGHSDLSNPDDVEAQNTGKFALLKRNILIKQEGHRTRTTSSAVTSAAY